MGAKGMLSERPRLYAPFQKLVDTMKYKPETPEQAAKRTEAQTERTRKKCGKLAGFCGARFSETAWQ